MYEKSRITAEGSFDPYRDPFSAGGSGGSIFITVTSEIIPKNRNYNDKNIGLYALGGGASDMDRMYLPKTWSEKEKRAKNLIREFEKIDYPRLKMQQKLDKIKADDAKKKEHEKANYIDSDDDDEEDDGFWEGDDDDGEARTCPGKHDLEKFQTPTNGWYCSECGPSGDGNYPSGTVMHGCRRCNYDLCDACFNTTSGRRKDVVEEDTRDSDDTIGLEATPLELKFKVDRFCEYLLKEEVLLRPKLKETIELYRQKLEKIEDADNEELCRGWIIHDARAQKSKKQKWSDICRAFENVEHMLQEESDQKKEEERDVVLKEVDGNMANVDHNEEAMLVQQKKEVDGDVTDGDDEEELLILDDDAEEVQQEKKEELSVLDGDVEDADHDEVKQHKEKEKDFLDLLTNFAKYYLQEEQAALEKDALKSLPIDKRDSDDTIGLEATPLELKFKVDRFCEYLLKEEVLLRPKLKETIKLYRQKLEKIEDADKKQKLRAICRAFENVCENMLQEESDQKKEEERDVVLKEVDGNMANVDHNEEAMLVQQKKEVDGDVTDGDDEEELLILDDDAEEVQQEKKEELSVLDGDVEDADHDEV
eukprot:1157652_1